MKNLRGLILFALFGGTQIVTIWAVLRLFGRWRGDDWLRDHGVLLTVP